MRIVDSTNLNERSKLKAKDIASDIERPTEWITGRDSLFDRVLPPRSSIYATRDREFGKERRDRTFVFRASWNVAKSCPYLFVYLPKRARCVASRRVYRLIHRDTFDRQKCQCTQEVLLFRIARRHDQTSLEIAAKWETAEVAAGPAGRHAACQIHRKRTGIVLRDSISVSRPFRRHFSRYFHQPKTGYFVCESFPPPSSRFLRFFFVNSNQAGFQINYVRRV